LLYETSRRHAGDSDDYGCLCDLGGFSATVLSLNLYHGPQKGHRECHCINPDSLYHQTGYIIELDLSVCAALVAFCVAIALSLADRYWAAEIMESQIRIDRLKARANESQENSDDVKVKIADAVEQRTHASKLSIVTIWSCPASLAMGIAFTGIAILIMICNG
jgi:hypothetical protein